MKRNKSAKVTAGFRLNKETVRALATKSCLEGCSKSSIVEQALRDFLRIQDKKEN